MPPLHARSLLLGGRALGTAAEGVAHGAVTVTLAGAHWLKPNSAASTAKGRESLCSLVEPRRPCLAQRWALTCITKAGKTHSKKADKLTL